MFEPFQGHVDIWIIHSEKRVLVTDMPGPPTAVCGFVSNEAAQAAKERGYATVSEIGFSQDVYFRAETWKAAFEIADGKAEELGYDTNISGYNDTLFEDLEVY